MNDASASQWPTLAYLVDVRLTADDRIQATFSSQEFVFLLNALNEVLEAFNERRDELATRTGGTYDELEAFFRHSLGRRFSIEESMTCVGPEATSLSPGRACSRPTVANLRLSLEAQRLAR
jgi:hypothetical protein